MNDPNFLKRSWCRTPASSAWPASCFPIPERGLASRLYRIRAKTLIWGREDKLIPPVYADAFKKAISKSKLTKIAKAGHAVGQEKPAAVLKAIRDHF